MADYSSAFSYANGKTNAPTVLDQGFRESTGQTYATTPNPRCVGCPQVANHGAIGTHFCNQNTATNPLAATHHFPRRLIREAQNYLSCQRWYVNGNKSDSPGYAINGYDRNNFSTWNSWKIVSASGTLLTLKVGSSLVDPREVQTYFRQIPDPNSEEIPPPLIQQQFSGSWCMPGDVVMISGNTPLQNRIQTKIVGVDFSSLPDTVTADSTWTVTVEHSVGNAVTRLWQPNDGDDIGIAVVYRKAYRTESWLECLDEESPFFCLKKVMTFDCTSWTEGPPLFVELLGHTNASTRISFPLTATFLAEYQRGNEVWVPFDWQNRIECDGTNTRFFIGTQGANGITLSSFLPYDATALRITYYAKVADPLTEGTISYHLNRCRHSLAIPPNVNVGGAFATANGRYCDYRTTIPAAIRNNYQANCWLFGKCPYFEPALQGWLKADHFKQLFGLTGDFLHQRVVGDPSNSNLYIETGGGGGFLYLAGIGFFTNKQGNFPAILFMDDRVFGWYVVVSDGEGNETLIFKYGSIWDEQHDYTTDQFPASITDDMQGLYPRKCSKVSKSQLSDDLISDAKPQWWRDVQMIPSIKKDPDTFGENITTGGGRERVQRFNKTERVFLPNLNTTSKDTPQGENHTVTFLSDPISIGEIDYSVVIKLKADGEQNFGTKYTGTVKSCTSVGDGRWVVEAELHAYQVSESVGGEDVTHTFYGSGGGIALPDPFKVSGHYQAEADQQRDPPNAKTMRGDTLTFANGLKFWISRADASCGTDMSSDPVKGTFPNSRDYPACNLAHLKKCDLYEIIDQNNSIEAIASSVVGQSFTINTDGIIYPESPVEVKVLNYGNETFTTIFDAIIDHAMGTILIPKSVLDILGDHICFEVYCQNGIANRSYETPAELIPSIIEHCQALDTVLGPGLIAGAGVIAISGSSYIGPCGFIKFRENEPYAEDDWYPTNVTHGYGSDGYYQGTLANQVGDIQVLEAGNEDYFAISVASDLAGLSGSGVSIAMPVWALSWQELLLRLPTGTVITDAKIEVSLTEGSFTKTIEHFVVYSMYSINRYAWITDLDYSIQPVTTNESSSPVSLMLLGYKIITDTWDVLGSYSLGTMEAGKRHVGSCADLITRLLDLRDSPYSSIHLTVACEEVANPLLVDKAQYEGLLEAMLTGWEKVELLSTEGSDVDTVLRGRRTCKSFTGSGFSLGNLVISYRLPDGAISTMKIQHNYPSWR